mgnify:CR=1 FL=1
MTKQTTPNKSLTGHPTPQHGLGILRDQDIAITARLEVMEDNGHHGSQLWGNLALEQDELRDEIKRLMWLDWPGDSPKES